MGPFLSVISSSRTGRLWYSYANKTRFSVRHQTRWWTLPHSFHRFPRRSKFNFSRSRIAVRRVSSARHRPKKWKRQRIEKERVPTNRLGGKSYPHLYERGAPQTQPMWPMAHWGPVVFSRVMDNEKTPRNTREEIPSRLHRVLWSWNATTLFSRKRRFLA